MSGWERGSISSRVFLVSLPPRSMPWASTRAASSKSSSTSVSASDLAASPTPRLLLHEAGRDPARESVQHAGRELGGQRAIERGIAARGGLEQVVGIADRDDAGVP